MANLLLSIYDHHYATSRQSSVYLTIPDHNDNDADNTNAATDPNNYFSLNMYSAAVLFEVFLYGLYLSLFAICMRVLVRNKKTTQKILVACAILMFLLATIDVVLEISFLFWFVMKQQIIPDENLHFKSLVYITSNVVADSLVIYRCYTLWGNDKRVISVPCFLLFAGTSCGYVFIGLSKQEYRFRGVLIAFLFTTVTLNILVSALMVGRIWWIARRARAILGPGLSRKYHMMIAMIIESGALYSIYVVLDVVFPNLIFDAGLAQVVGIVPTLIIVQIGLGRNTRDVDTTVSAVRTETHAFATRDYTYDVPPSASPTIPAPAFTPLAIPPISQSISRGHDSRCIRDEERQSGIS